MIEIPVELERQIVAHETTCDDTTGALEVLEKALVIQLRTVADGLLADIVLRGDSISGGAWWQQILSRQEKPTHYLPNLKAPELLSYRKDFAQQIVLRRIKRIGIDELTDVSIRILGGHCRFADEGKINRQLTQFGSSLRLFIIGTHRDRVARLRSMLSNGVKRKSTLDGRFIFGRIGPVSICPFSIFPVSISAGASLFIFEREFAVSPYMEAGANGFTDQARIVIRQDVLRGDIEQEIRRLESEGPVQTRKDGLFNEREIPLTVAHGMLRKALRRKDGSLPEVKEMLAMMTRSVLTHESAHILFDGTTISQGIDCVTSWHNAIREDLLRFAQQPRTLSAFQSVFAEYFCEDSEDVIARMWPIPEGGFTVKKELETLRSAGLLFMDSDNRYYSTLYGKGQRWTL